MAMPSSNPVPHWLVVTLTLSVALWNPLVARGQQSDPCSNMAPPPGAKILGYVNKVFCVAPTIADISTGDLVPNKLFRGPWYDKKDYPMSMYSSSGQSLVLTNGASVTTETRKSLPGVLPLLLASSGFYVEFAERISDNDPDHWPAVWMMPKEHNAAHSDHQAGDPANYERWIELDVDEGGINKTGHHGAMISWWGMYPHYQLKNAGNDPRSTPPMDRTQEHIFGLSYDPTGETVAWWVDGVMVGTASTVGLKSIIQNHHYYLIMSNQNHGLNRPYNMYIRYFSAWSGNPVPNPPSGVRAEPASQQ